jgi:choline dehydrogenase-like flavoprotein
MAPYYQKFHTLNLPDNELSDHLSLDWAENGGRGVSGPLQISFTASAQDPFAKPWIETFRNLNLPLTADPALGKGTGGYSAPGTVDPATKTRSSSASAFYTPAEKKPNLHVVTGAQVQKILFEQAGLNLTTTGVSFRILQYSSENVAKAKKEVILAAGTFQSPKLLELSGIGSAELLRKHGIPVLVHNPHVGEHLRDHLLTGICFEVKDGLATADGLLRQEPDAMQTAMQLYAEHKTGPLAAAGWSSHAFVPVLDIPSESDRQMELQKIFEQYPPEAGDEFQFNFVRSALEDREVASSAFLSFSAQCNLHADFFTKDLQPGNFVTIGTYQVHPVSSGSVHISSPDPVATPIIDPRYLSHPLDVEIMAWCLQFIEKIAETEPVRSLLKPGGKRNHPTAYVKDLKAARDYARTTASTGYHPVSTCVMLPREKGGVVNERLIVYGTTNLRVVDASVMVVIPRGNTQSSVYAIAERAADIIKEDNHLRI